MVRALALLCLAAIWTGAAPLKAEDVAFDGSWKEQRFLQLFTNDYIQRGAALDILSDGTVSLLWRLVPPDGRDARAASWQWAVSEGVRATDLTIKGGDDRNLALYFVFGSREAEARADRGRLRAFVMHPTTRVLAYIWGGDLGRGRILPNPYNDHAKTVILRDAGVGAHRERVDLIADYSRAFGAPPERLIGLAVISDSDDTDGRVIARIANLRLE